jgi:thiol:disulfide interchange protein DsbC
MKQIIKERKDIVFYLKMMPIVKIHPEAYEKSKTIVCESSNEKAIKLLEDVYEKRKIPKPNCDTDVIDKNIQLARRFGINGTPTLIFEDGSRINGAMKADDLIKLIDSKKIK